MVGTLDQDAWGTHPLRGVSGHIQLGEGSRVGPGLAGRIIYPSWTGSDSGSCRRSGKGLLVGKEAWSWS